MGRKASLGAKYTKIKKSITDYLISKGVNEDTDMYLIDELIYNLSLADQAKDDIEVRGLYVGDDGWRANPSVSIYMQCIKNVNAISSKLGITVQERKKLNLSSETADELEDVLG